MSDLRVLAVYIEAFVMQLLLVIVGSGAGYSQLFGHLFVLEIEFSLF